MGRIPKILHHTFGMARDFGGKPWSLVHHVCLSSAVERIRPDQTFLYYEFEPYGPWWELSRKLVTPVRIEAPRSIFGRKLTHVAHRADVVRLQMLIEHGGIYLDADVLVQKSFDDLLAHRTVLGREGSEGLANAVILAEPRSSFLCRWLEEYRSFQGGLPGTPDWNFHSVHLPAKIAQAHPREVTILPPSAFYWPLWTEDHLQWIFESTRPIFQDHVYANHLWENFAWKYLEDLTPGRVRSIDTNFHVWARPLIDNLPDNFGAPSLLKRLQKYNKRMMSKAHTWKFKAKHRVTAVRKGLRG